MITAINWRRLVGKEASQNFSQNMEIKSSIIAYMISPITVNKPQVTGFCLCSAFIFELYTYEIPTPNQQLISLFFVNMIYLFGQKQHSSYIELACVLWSADRIQFTILSAFQLPSLLNVQLNSKHIGHNDILIIAN